jgi:hypothetical protein
MKKVTPTNFLDNCSNPCLSCCSSWHSLRTGHKCSGEGVSIQAHDLDETYFMARNLRRAIWNGDIDEIRRIENKIAQMHT